MTTTVWMLSIPAGGFTWADAGDTAPNASRHDVRRYSRARRHGQVASGRIRFNMLSPRAGACMLTSMAPQSWNLGRAGRVRGIFVAVQPHDAQGVLVGPSGLLEAAACVLPSPFCSACCWLPLLHRRPVSHARMSTAR